MRLTSDLNVTLVLYLIVFFEVNGLRNVRFRAQNYNTFDHTTTELGNANFDSVAGCASYCLKTEGCEAFVTNYLEGGGTENTNTFTGYNCVLAGASYTLTTTATKMKAWTIRTTTNPKRTVEEISETAPEECPVTWKKLESRGHGGPGQGTITMSSENHVYTASRCFDGILDNFCQTSKSEVNPWLSIKLPQPAWIQSVTVVNRNGGMPEALRFKNAIAMVGSVSPTANSQIFTNGNRVGEQFAGGLAPGATHKFEGNQAVWGDVITVQLLTEGYFHLSEVFFYYGNGLAWEMKIAPVGGSAISSIAALLDGNPATFVHSNEAEFPWLQVNLGRRFRVTKVAFLSASEVLMNMDIRVGNDYLTTGMSHYYLQTNARCSLYHGPTLVPNQWVDVECDRKEGMLGQYVSLQLTERYESPSPLDVAELEVFGWGRECGTEDP